MEGKDPTIVKIEQKFSFKIAHSATFVSISPSEVI